MCALQTASPGVYFLPSYNRNEIQEKTSSSYVIFHSKWFSQANDAAEDKTPRLSAVPNSMAESPDANAPPKEVPGRIEGELHHPSLSARNTDE